MMAARMVERSARAFVDYSRALGFAPTRAVVAGVGIHQPEAIVFKEEWPQVELIGFEPNIFTFATIGPTFPGTLTHAALNDRPGKVDFYARERWKDGSSLHQPHDVSIKPVKVQCVRLDSFFKDKEKPDLLWLDCEGNELRALVGARDVLKSVKVVNVEITGKGRGEGWCKQDDVNILLEDAGFLHTWTHTIRSCIGQSDAIYVRSDIFNPDFCCVPSSITKWRSQWRREKPGPAKQL